MFCTKLNEVFKASVCGDPTNGFATIRPIFTFVVTLRACDKGIDNEIVSHVAHLAIRIQTVNCVGIAGSHEYS